MTDKPRLSKADRKRLKELRRELRDVAKNFYHPALWYGAEPAIDAASLIAEERARLKAEIERLTAPAPVLEGAIVRKPVAQQMTLL